MMQCLNFIFISSLNLHDICTQIQVYNNLCEFMLVMHFVKHMAKQPVPCVWYLCVYDMYTYSLNTNIQQNL